MTEQPQSQINEEVPGSGRLAGPYPRLCQRQRPCNRIAQLIGKKAILKCHINGFSVSALLDTGAQVSIIDYTWKSRYLPEQVLRPLCEIVGRGDFSVSAVNGDPLPFEGWIELTVNLPGNDDTNLTITFPCR